MAKKRGSHQGTPRAEAVFDTEAQAVAEANRRRAEYAKGKGVSIDSLGSDTNAPRGYKIIDETIEDKIAQIVCYSVAPKKSDALYHAARYLRLEAVVIPLTTEERTEAIGDELKRAFKGTEGLLEMARYLRRELRRAGISWEDI